MLALDEADVGGNEEGIEAVLEETEDFSSPNCHSFEEGGFMMQHAC